MRRRGRRFGRFCTSHTLKYCKVCSHTKNSAEILVNSLPLHLAHRFSWARASDKLPLTLSLNKRKRWTLVRNFSKISEGKTVKSPYVDFPSYGEGGRYGY